MVAPPVLGTAAASSSDLRTGFAWSTRVIALPKRDILCTLATCESLSQSGCPHSVLLHSVSKGAPRRPAGHEDVLRADR